MEKMKDRRVAFGCALPIKLLEKIDGMRGQLPRTRYLECFILKALEDMPTSKRKKGAAVRAEPARKTTKASEWSDLGPDTLPGDIQDPRLRLASKGADAPVVSQ